MKLIAINTKVSLVYLLCVLLYGCAEKIEQSISFYDTYLEQQLVKELKEKSIPFRQEGHTIWYEVTYKNEVKYIFDQEVSNRPMYYKYYDVEDKNLFLNKLKQVGISDITESQEGDAYIVYIPAKYKGALVDKH